MSAPWWVGTQAWASSPGLFEALSAGKAVWDEHHGCWVEATRVAATWTRYADESPTMPYRKRPRLQDGPLSKLITAPPEAAITRAPVGSPFSYDGGEHATLAASLDVKRAS